jgi:hypothetical protein
LRRGAGGDRLLPVRVPVAGVERPVTVDAIRVVSIATVPGWPASGISRGGRPARPPRASRVPRPARRSIASGFW